MSRDPFHKINIYMNMCSGGGSMSNYGNTCIFILYTFIYTYRSIYTYTLYTGYCSLLQYVILAVEHLFKGSKYKFFFNSSLAFWQTSKSNILSSTKSTNLQFTIAND